jgi:hypothetical protein
MLPSISLAFAVEKLRDGGSLCASFQGTNGSQYWLVFPVRRENGLLEGYSTPVVIERPLAAEEMHISWKHAEVLLGQVERLLDDDSSRNWIPVMREAIRKEGKCEVI